MELMRQDTFNITDNIIRDISALVNSEERLTRRLRRLVEESKELHRKQTEEGESLRKQAEEAESRRATMFERFQLSVEIQQRLFQDGLAIEELGFPFE